MRKRSITVALLLSLLLSLPARPARAAIDPFGWWRALTSAASMVVPNGLGDFIENVARFAAQIGLVEWRFAGGTFINLLSVPNFIGVSENERRRICAETRGLGLAHVSVQACVDGVQWVHADFLDIEPSLNSQPQLCEGGKGMDYGIACVYADGRGQYYWDDGPSIPAAADGLLHVVLGHLTERYATLFWPAGQMHDYCYHHEPVTYGNSRSDCDDEFLGNMRGICNTPRWSWLWDWFDLAKCHLAAITMYGFVRSELADPAWEATKTLVNYRKMAATGAPYGFKVIGGPGAQFALAGSRLYGLSPDHSGIYRYQTPPWQWEWVGGPAESLIGGDTTLYASGPGNAYIARLDGASWTIIGGPGAEWVADGTGVVYGLSPDRNEIYRRDPINGEWSWIGGAAQHLYAGGGRLYASSPGNTAISELDPASGAWTEVGGPGLDWVVSGGGELFGQSPGDRSVWHHDGNGAWSRVGGPAEHIFRADVGVYATRSGTLQITKLSGENWIHLGGPATTVVQGSGSSVYGVSAWTGEMVEFWGPFVPQRPSHECDEPDRGCPQGMDWDSDRCSCECPRLGGENVPGCGDGRVDP
jgi:hypothetical protein